MKNKSCARLLTAAVPLFVCCVGMVCAPLALAAEDHDGPAGRCSNETLNGSYGLTIEGSVAVPRPGLPLRGVVLQHYDGRGGITQVDHVVTNGAPPPEAWRPSTGAYSVNSDCSGTATLNLPGGSPLVVFFVVANHGKIIRQVVDGNAIVATSERVD